MSYSTPKGFVSTAELAEIFQVKPQSIRHAFCCRGHYCNIIPIKLPNRLLAWPIGQIPLLIWQHYNKQEINISFEKCLMHSTFLEVQVNEKSDNPNNGLTH